MLCIIPDLLGWDCGLDSCDVALLLGLSSELWTLGLTDAESICLDFSVNRSLWCERGLVARLTYN